MTLRRKYFYLSLATFITFLIFLFYDYTRLTTLIQLQPPLAAPSAETPNLINNHPHQNAPPKKIKQHDLFEYDDVLEQLESLPREYLVGGYLPRSVNSTCARFPKYTTIEYNNFYWQSVFTSNGTFHFYGAYLDDRKPGRVVVRLLGVVDRKQPTVTTYCQLWFKNKRDPVIVKSDRYRYVWLEMWGTEGKNQPYFVDCVLPTAEKLTPFAVSLVEKPCENATNSLRIINNKPAAKKRFAVCVKGLDYLHDDISVRLVEWLELNRALGVEKVYFYYFSIHPNITKTLQYYKKADFVDFTPLTLPGGYPNLPQLRHLVLSSTITQRRQMEVIPYNDCFYKHMYEYDYIVLLDIDEIIMPKTGNWHDLINTLENDEKLKTASGFYTRNIYFLDQFLPKGIVFPDIPKFLHIMNHVYRTQEFTPPKHYVKTFHKTSEVLTLHNHLPLQCVTWICRLREIDPKLAQLQHYRAECARGLKAGSCEELKRSTVMDSGVWRFRDVVVDRAVGVLTDLGYLGG